MTKIGQRYFILSVVITVIGEQIIVYSFNEVDLDI